MRKALGFFLSKQDVFQKSTVTEGILDRFIHHYSVSQIYRKLLIEWKITHWNANSVPRKKRMIHFEWLVKRHNSVVFRLKPVKSNSSFIGYKQHSLIGVDSYGFRNTTKSGKNIVEFETYLQSGCTRKTKKYITLWDYPKWVTRFFCIKMVLPNRTAHRKYAVP